MWTSSHVETGQYHFPRLVLLPHKHRILVERDVQLFQRHRMQMSQCAAVEHHLPSPQAVEKTICQSNQGVPAEVHTICVLASPNTMRDVKKERQNAMVYSYFAAVASLLDPTLLALKLELKIATSTFEWEATTFCSYEIEPKEKQPKQAAHSHGHWLIDPFFVALLELLQHAEQPFRPLLNPYSLSCKAEWKTIAPLQEIAQSGCECQGYVSSVSFGVCFARLSPERQKPGISFRGLFWRIPFAKVEDPSHT